MDVAVLVGEVAQILLPGVVDDPGERRRRVGAGRELPVAEVDRHLVPVADPRLVGLGDVDGAVGLQLLERMRVVHHRDPALGAVVVVVAEAQGVADLVGRQLANARQRRLVEDRGPFGASLVGRQQPFEDHVVLAVAQRPQRHRRLDDFAGARVGHAAAGAPAAGRAVHPVDHVVADVHRIGVGRQHLDLEGVAEAGGFERLVPPHGALDQRLLHVLRRAGIDPVSNRRHRLAHRRGRVLLHQAMAAQIAEHDRLADRLAEIDEAQSAVPGAWVVDARLVAVGRQLDERQVLPQGHRVGSRRHAGDGAAEQVAAEAAPPPPPPVAPICAGPCAGPAPPRGATASLTKVSSMSTSVFLGNALVCSR